MWMNGDSRSNLSAWLVWVSNFNFSLSSSKWFFFHRHIGMCFTFQALPMLAWVREEKKEDFCMNTSHVVLQQCPLALQKLHVHCASCSQFWGISGLAVKDSFPKKMWNSKGSQGAEYFVVLFQWISFIFFFDWTKGVSKAFTLQT